MVDLVSPVSGISEGADKFEKTQWHYFSPSYVKNCNSKTLDFTKLMSRDIAGVVCFLSVNAYIGSRL